MSTISSSIHRSYENLFQFDFHSKFRHFRSRATFPPRFESGIESHPARPIAPRRGSKTRPITKRYRATRNTNIYACIAVIPHPCSSSTYSYSILPNFYLSADFSLGTSFLGQTSLPVYASSANTGRKTGAGTHLARNSKTNRKERLAKIVR